MYSLKIPEMDCPWGDQVTSIMFEIFPKRKRVVLYGACVRVCKLRPEVFPGPGNRDDQRNGKSHPEHSKDEIIELEVDWRSIAHGYLFSERGR